MRRVLTRVTASAALASRLVIVHALYGARRYDNPALAHAIAPALLWLVLAAILAAVYARRPGPIKRWVLVALVALPYVGLFGLVHGAIGHGLKLLFHAAGTSAARLAALFDLGDFVVPDDAFFEATGVGTFAAGLLVGYFLVRFLRVTRAPGAPGGASDET
jgi:hypothetical protein